MAKATDPAPSKPVTRDDLEKGFAGIQHGLKRQVDDKKPTILTIGGGVGLLLVVIVFLMGRRSGKKKTTFVEIRRV